jgi:hypothetical protein
MGLACWLVHGQFRYAETFNGKPQASLLYVKLNKEPTVQVSDTTDA